MKNKIFRSVLVTLLAVLLCLGTASCSAGNKRSGAMDSEPHEAGDYGLEAKKLYSYVLESKASDGGQEPEESRDAQYADKIIRTVTISAQTKDYDRTIDEIFASVKSLGGYEESSKTSGNAYGFGASSRSARLTVRIPAEKLDEFLGTVGELVNVTSKTSGAENVTAEYYDIKARIDVLEGEKAAYQEMLTKSTDVSSMLEIERRLYDVIEEIESYETKLRVYDNKVSYSTVTIYLDEVVEYTAPKKDNFFTRFGNAFAESWQDFGEGFLDFIVGLVYVFPTLLVLAAIAVVIILIVRRARRKKKSKQQQ